MTAVTAQRSYTRKLSVFTVDTACNTSPLLLFCTKAATPIFFDFQPDLSVICRCCGATVLSSMAAFE